MQKSPENSDFSPAETQRRMEAGIRKALSTPHKPNEKFKREAAGKRKPKRKAATAKRAKR